MAVEERGWGPDQLGESKLRSIGALARLRRIRVGDVMSKPGRRCAVEHDDVHLRGSRPRARARVALACRLLSLRVAGFPDRGHGRRAHGGAVRRAAAVTQQQEQDQGYDNDRAGRQQHRRACRRAS